jgi:uncharacterized membrane protein
MFQTHCFDSWLSPAARQTSFFRWSQLCGTLPAPLFLFLAGISLALVTNKLRSRGMADSGVARITIRRGAEILGLGLLFHLQQYLFSWRWVPWTDVLRVDILNNIGLSMMMMGLLCWLIAICGKGLTPDTLDGDRPGQVPLLTILAACTTALAIAMATPPLWTTHRPRFLPWPIESYIDGIHTFAEPKGWLFPIFPWTGFAFAGLAIGFILFSDFAKRNETAVFVSLGVSGGALILLSQWIDRQPRQLYAVYDYWKTSPEFFLARVGVLLVLTLLVYAWCRWGAAQIGFSPFLQLGQTSLLVYWLHIEFVYNRLIILPSHGNSIGRAAFGFFYICVLMLILSMIRTRTKGRGPELLARLRMALRPA